MAGTARRVGAYAKLLANYASDDALMEAGEAAELLFVRGLAFCATSDSDGFITEAQMTRYVAAGMRDPAKRAKRLVEVGVWLRVDGGYLVRSWTKLHETSVEKGRRLKTDRERKKSGTPDDSERNGDRNPDGIRAEGASDSLSMTQDRIQGQGTGQDTDRESAHSAAPTAQTIVGEWIDRCPKRPPGRVIGQVAKHAGAMLAEGLDPDDIRRGLATWMTKGLDPSTLPSVVNQVMNATPSTGASGKAAGWLALEPPRQALNGDFG
jgi:hypothetical protein